MAKDPDRLGYGELASSERLQVLRNTGEITLPRFIIYKGHVGILAA